MNLTTLQAIHDHVVADFPREACGVVCVVKGRERYVRCRNNARSPTEQFILDPQDYADAEELGEIVSIVHSHPNASPRPSAADKVGCEASGLPWHIVSVSIPTGADAPQAGEMRTIEPCGYQAPLIGRPFHHGVLDCYTLVQDFYERELGIRLSNYTREDDWWLNGQDLYSLDRLRAEGFEPITDEPKYGDMIVMQVRAPVSNHAGVYLGDDTMIHHMHGRLASRDMYAGYWREMTRMIVRHKERQ